MMQPMTLCAETLLLTGFVRSTPLNRAGFPVERGVIVVRAALPSPHGAQRYLQQQKLRSFCCGKD
jgi:hypothetical protein